MFHLYHFPKVVILITTFSKNFPSGALQKNFIKIREKNKRNMRAIFIAFTLVFSSTIIPEKCKVTVQINKIIFISTS